MQMVLEVKQACCTVILRSPLTNETKNLTGKQVISATYIHMYATTSIHSMCHRYAW